MILRVIHVTLVCVSLIRAAVAQFHLFFHVPRLIVSNTDIMQCICF